MSTDISIDLVKKLREKSGVGIADCKKALIESKGDIDKAFDILRERGILKAGERGGRDTNEGMIVSYIHQNNKLGSLVELDCETDFVAKTDVLKDLAYNIAIQVVGMNPIYVSREDVPKDIIKKEEDIIVKDETMKDKPQNVKENILKGKMDKFFSEVCLLEQVYYKDNSITITNLLNEAISKTGENIKIKRFVRFEIGK
ncbi:elongation factor Ts [Patescibacteria group bacterium]|nr:elongation factor Ts [Patescibacteria group bacterium]